MSHPGPEELNDIDRGLREIFQFHKNLLTDFDPDQESRGLNRTHWRTLLFIADSGPECMKGICRNIGLEAGSFTPVADRLIEKGLVERIRDTRDRRRILLRTTPNGDLAGREIRARMKDHFSDRLSNLNSEELSELASAMNTIRKVNRKMQRNTDG